MGARVTREPSRLVKSWLPVQTAVLGMSQSGGAKAFVRLNRVLAGSVFFIRSWTSVIVSYRPQNGTACGGDITGAAGPVWRRQSPSWALPLSFIPADSIFAIAFRGTLGLARKALRARTMEMGTTRAATFDDAHVTAPCDNFFVFLHLFVNALGAYAAVANRRSCRALVTYSRCRVCELDRLFVGCITWARNVGPDGGFFQL